ncbi:hypothetical protein O1M63_28680 [Streptomyces mirabilis]|nr:hypothetical protein [Streptomyces mirabilis]
MGMPAQPRRVPGLAARTGDALPMPAVSIGTSGSAISFMETSQANSASYASHTLPMPPAPSVRSSRYRPPMILPSP